MIFDIGDMVDADDGVRQIKNGIITELGTKHCYFIGEDIFIGSELTLVKRVMSRARDEADEAILLMIKG
jgi:hypothetical protein